MVHKILSFFRRLVVFIFLTPFLKRLRSKSPALYSFLAKRFSLHKFSGMPLTLLFIALAANLLMMLDVYEDILNTKEFISVDNTLATFLFSIRVDSIATLFYVITQLGNPLVVVFCFALMSVFLLLKKKGYAIWGLLAAVSGSALTVQLGKHLFKINRPVQLSYYHMDSFSFPSGHATAAVAFYGMVFYLLIRNVKTVKAKSGLLITGLILILLIGFSRLYLCEHFLSDVLGGYLLGLLWLLLSLGIVLWKEDRMKRKQR